MSAEYVDTTPIGDGGAPIVTLDAPTETQADDALNVSEDKAAEIQGEQPVAQGEQGEQPVAEAAAAEEAQIEAKTPEEKASYWRGEHFKSKQVSESRITELENQLLEVNATPAFLKLDVPPDQWNPKEQIEAMPLGYADKVRSYGFWETLPTVVNNIDQQSPEVKAALYNTFKQVLEQETGIPFEDIIEAGVSRGQSAPTQSQPQSDNEIQQLEASVQALIAEGYTDSDPALANAKMALSSERRAVASEGQVRQLTADHNRLLQRLDKTDKSQQAYTQQQAEATFESKKKAVWDNVLKTFESKVINPTHRRMIRNDAKAVVDADPKAQGFLHKAKGFLMAATNPKEQEQYERLAAGSMVAYNAFVAIEVQKAWKELAGDDAEKEHLRSTVAQHQLMRRDITPGQSGAPLGSRAEILKGKIGDNADIAQEMAAAIYRSRKAS